ncbi:MAG: hypothetical protein Q9162_006703 [Coniocarpon cinnabarinum]
MSYKRTRKEFEADLQAQQSPYVFYGTPLPPLDPEVRDDGSYVPIWQQEVRDDRGRKRLHGAFTGGFSAGYFNTVGSKEGWTPVTFVSSRSNRAKDGKTAEPRQQRPEDFMDEEDLAAAAEAQTVEANDKFAGLGTTDQDEQHRGALMDLFRPQEDTMGVRLLRKMGWKDGQGIGPRIRRKVDAADGTQQHLFAPENSQMVQFNRKDDRKGLGYRGEARLKDQEKRAKRHEDDDDEAAESAGLVKPKFKSKTNKRTSQAKKSAFGVGVLNDDGSDDDDPYSMGPRVSYKKTISVNKRDRGDDSNRPTVIRPNSNLDSKSKHTFRPKEKQSSGHSRKCHDGKLPLDGFVLAEPLASLSLSDDDDKYAPPEVPAGWQLSRLASESRGDADYVSTADAAKASKLDAKSRGMALGETQLPGKSVFDFLSPAARDRLAAASKNDGLPPGRGELIPGNDIDTKDAMDVDLPQLDTRTAQEALRRGAVTSLRNADEAKRSRYENFLQFRAEVRSDPPQPGQKMSTSEWIAELDVFAASARSFKPMSGLMASRFTSAGVSKPSDDTLKQELSSKPVKPKDPAEEAASMGMFGPMTRSHQQFFPTRLVCKRFGVRMPPHAEDEGRNQPSMTGAASAVSSSIKPTTELVSDRALEQLRTQVSLPVTASQARVEPSLHLEKTETERIMEHPQTMAGKDDGADIIGHVTEVDASRNEALEGQRAGEEVFKAIFGDDEDSDDSG